MYYLKESIVRNTICYFDEIIVIYIRTCIVYNISIDTQMCRLLHTFACAYQFNDIEGKMLHYLIQIMCFFIITTPHIHVIIFYYTFKFY